MNKPSVKAMDSDRRTYIYLNFDIDPFTAELVFPQGIAKGGCVSLVFGSFQKSAENRKTKFTEQFAKMVSQRFRVSSPIVEGSPQCFIRISLMKDGPPAPQLPKLTGAENSSEKSFTPDPKPIGEDVPSPDDKAASSVNGDQEPEEATTGRDDSGAQANETDSISGRSSPGSVAGDGNANPEDVDNNDDDDDDEGDDVDIAPFNCEKCSMPFESSHQLKKHETTEHNILHYCQHCHRKFFNKFGLVRHMWSHLPSNRLPFRYYILNHSCLLHFQWSVFCSRAEDMLKMLAMLGGKMHWLHAPSSAKRC